ncbi:DUF5958 family protein [Streptomyces sp. NPDC057592]
MALSGLRPDQRSTWEDRFSHCSQRRRKAFRLLVAVLAIADGRRRERYCSNGCGHWLSGAV